VPRPAAVARTGLTIAHAHHHERPHLQRPRQRRALAIVLAANLAFLVVEVIGGFAFHSLALLADATHLASDVLALVVALAALALIERPATSRHSYGFQRAEVLAAQFNGVLLLGVTVVIVVEAVQRLAHPSDVQGAGVVAVATAGLVVNLACALVLARAKGRSLNMHGAFLHMAADAAGCFAAAVAGVAAWVWGADRLDPVASIVIAALIAWSTWGLLRDTTNVLLEGTPAGIDTDEVLAALESDPAVDAVHHLHLWSLASDEPSLSAHVVIGGEVTLHEAQQRGTELKAMLADRFDIHHSTLELECHACDEEIEDVVVRAEPAGSSLREEARRAGT
jgi:cobalt-zinc-cadmium efflux system protein